MSAFGGKRASISHAVELYFEQKATYNILATDLEATPHFFAKWKINRPAGPPDMSMRLPEYGHSCIIKRDTGAGNVQFGLAESFTDASYTSRVVTASIAASEESRHDGFGDDSITPTNNFFACVAFNSNGSTTGTVRGFFFSKIINIPPGHSITRVL